MKSSEALITRKSCDFLDHSPVRLDVNYRKEKKKTIKYTKLLNILKNTFMNNQQITEEIKKEIKMCIEMHENTTTQNLWDT